MNPEWSRMRNRSLFFSCFLLALAGCGGTAGTRGSGTIKVETRPAAGFHVLRIRAGQVKVRQGDQEGLTITTDDNLVPLLETSVAGGELTLQNKPGSNLQPSKSIRYDVVVKDLDTLIVEGDAMAGLAGLKGKDFTLQVDGKGQVELDGLKLENLQVKLRGDYLVRAAAYAPNHVVALEGAGEYDGSRVVAENVKISSQGTGKAVVYAEKKLDVSLSGSPTVTYVGRPTVNKAISGVGQLIEGPESLRGR